MTALERPTVRNRLPTDLSPTGKLVYLYLSECGDASVERLKQSLGVPQLRLYPTLRSLERRGLIDRAGDQFSITR